MESFLPKSFKKGFIKTHFINTTGVSNFSEDADCWWAWSGQTGSTVLPVPRYQFLPDKGFHWVIYWSSVRQMYIWYVPDVFHTFINRIIIQIAHNRHHLALGLAPVILSAICLARGGGISVGWLNASPPPRDGQWFTSHSSVRRQTNPYHKIRARFCARCRFTRFCLAGNCFYYFIVNRVINERGSAHVRRAFDVHNLIISFLRRGELTRSFTTFIFYFAKSPIMLGAVRCNVGSHLLNDICRSDQFWFISGTSPNVSFPAG